MAPTTPPATPGPAGQNLAEYFSQAGFPFRLDVVPTLNVHANPWNPNKMDDPTRSAARESIATFGFIDPITVREHPELDGHYQIIDGEHRWQEARELGYEHLPAVILTVDNAAAKKLTIIFNETRGEADSVLLGTLLADLQRELGDDDLRVGLRYDPRELQHLLALADEDWAGYDPAGEGDGDGSGDGGDEGDWRTLTFRVPPGVADVYGQARERAIAGGDVTADGKDERVIDGLVLEVLAAGYLAE